MTDKDEEQGVTSGAGSEKPKFKSVDKNVANQAAVRPARPRFVSPVAEDDDDDLFNDLPV